MPLKNRLLWLLAALLLALGLVWYGSTLFAGAPTAGRLQAAWQGDERWQVGELAVHWRAASEQLQVYQGEALVWQSVAGEPWLGAAVVLGDSRRPAPTENEDFPAGLQACGSQNWFDVRLEAAAITLMGRMECADRSARVRLTVAARADGPGVRLDWSLPGLRGMSWLATARQRDERTYGLGPLVPAWQLKSARYRLPAESLTHTASLAPVLLTSYPRALLVPTGYPGVLDLTQADRVRLEAWPDADGVGLHGQLSIARAGSAGRANTPGSVLAALTQEAESVAPEHDSASPWPASVEDLVRQRFTLALQGQVANDGLGDSGYWLPDPTAPAALQLAWLKVAGLAALLADEWPQTAFAEASLLPYLRIHAERFAHLHESLSPYREAWRKSAREAGEPALRPVWLDYPVQDGAWQTGFAQFLLGSEILVVNADPLQSAVTYYLPPGDWTELWSGQAVASTGELRRVTPTVGEPVIWLRGRPREHTDLVAAAESVSVSRLLGSGQTGAGNSGPLRLE